jgi:HlyD family secretion protein
MTTTLSRTVTGSARPLPSPNAGRKRRRRWVGRAAWAVLAAGGIAGLTWAWQPKAVAIDVAKVSRGDLVVTVEEVARTRVRDRYVVSAPLGGNLLRIELRPGDTVDAGGVLARIAPMESPLLDPRTKVEAMARSAAANAGERQARAAVARAELAAEHAQEELVRDRRLAGSGSITEQAVTRAELEVRLRNEELASSRFAAQMAAHEAAMARATLARFDGPRSTEGFDVPAPVRGSVLRVLSQSAGPVQPGTPLVEVGDPAALEVVTEVLSADAVRIAPGARATLERWGGPALRAHVRRVEPSGFTRLSALGVEEQRVAVIVDLDEARERWASLGDGFRVEARIVLEEKAGVLQVPAGSVFRHGSGWATYVVEDGRVRLSPVVLGSRGDALVEVRDGLREEMVVVVHPSERVKHGVKVAER